MAIACLAERAPCLPLRMSSISSRTNSPACVLGAFPARAFFRARSRVRFSGMGFPSVEFSQLVLRALEHGALRARHAAAGAVEVEVEHGHGGAKRRALAPAAVLRRSLKRLSHRARRALSKHAVLKIKRIAGAHHVRGPTFAPLSHRPRGAMRVPARPLLLSAARFLRRRGWR